MAKDKKTANGGLTTDEKLAKLGEWSWRLRHGLSEVMDEDGADPKDILDRVGQAEKAFGKTRKPRRDEDGEDNGEDDGEDTEPKKIDTAAVLDRRKPVRF